MEKDHVPSLMELMDRATLRAVNALTGMGLPESTGALLLVAFDTPEPGEDPVAVGALFEAAGASEVVPAQTQAESEMLLHARRSVHHAMESLAGTTMIDDVCVPRSRLAETLEGTAAIGEKYGLTIGVCAHAGDGNTHLTVCFDPGEPDETRRARAAFDAVMALGLELGGAITGEHGAGVLKKEWLARELGPVGLEMQRAIKEAFDPLGLLNPGKLF
jgi:glycolate oxidase